MLSPYCSAPWITRSRHDRKRVRRGCDRLRFSSGGGSLNLHEWQSAGGRHAARLCEWRSGSFEWRTNECATGPRTETKWKLVPNREARAEEVVVGTLTNAFARADVEL